MTIVANLAAFPAVAPALLLGIAASLAGLLWFPLGRLLSLFALLPMRYLELVADALAKAPVAYVTSRGGPVVLLVGAGLFVVVTPMVAHRQAALTPHGGRRGRGVAAPRVVDGDGRGSARRAHGAVLRRRPGRLGAGDQSRGGLDPDRRRPRRGAGRHRAGRARREAARRRGGEPSARRSHRRAPERAGALPGRTGPGARLRSDRRAAGRARPGDRRRRHPRRSTRARARPTRWATCDSTSCRRTSAGPAPSPTRTTTRSWCG